MFGLISKLFADETSEPAKRTSRLNAEQLESRELLSGNNPYTLLSPSNWNIQQATGYPASTVAPFSLAGVSGLPTPGPNVNYATVAQATQTLNAQFRAALSQVAAQYSPQALQRAGLSADLAVALSDAAQRTATAPSILDARLPTVTDFNAALNRLRAGANNPAYILNSSGFRRDLLIAGGYGHIVNLTPNQLAAAALNDPYIGLLSGNLTAQATQRYLQRFFNVTGGFNGVAIGNAAGLGNGITGNLALLQGIGGTGLSRPPGTGTGSPFVNGLLGIQPQVTTYQPAYPTPYYAPAGYPPLRWY